jgi:Ca2+:H+ antiporter
MIVKLEKTTLVLLAFVPLSLYLRFFTQEMTLTFIAAILAIIPLSRIIGFATNELVLQTRPVFGGLLNATLGNAVELIIAVFALREGLLGLVQASIVGSILNNLLLLIGLSIFFGGIRYKEQTFNKDSVGVSSTMLIIAMVGLAIPTVYSLTSKAVPRNEAIISNSVAVVLAVIYLAGLVFAFFTHKHLFDSNNEVTAEHEKPQISTRVALAVLCVSMTAVIFVSELLVEGFKYATADLGLSQTFLGVVVVAIITNIAEKINAIHFALENKLDVALEIGLSSATQIALFVVPLLVFISHVLGYKFSLVFSTFEIVSVFFTVMIINYLSSDGKCNWLEGAQLLSVYLIIAIAVYFV